MYWGNSNKKVKGRLNFKYKKQKISTLRIAMYVLPLTIIVLSIVTVVFAMDYEKKINSTKTVVSSEVIEDDQDKNKDSLIIVNETHKLSRSYSPSIVSCKGVLCNEIAKNDLEKLIDAANKNGYKLELTCGYTTESEQQRIYDEKIESVMKSDPSCTKVKAIIEVNKMMGASDSDEHRTGLLFDFKVKGQSAESFQDSDAYKWMLRYAPEYGFILRFPKSKEFKTRIYFNPNSFRFVGRSNAKNMQITGTCLEEFVDS